MKKVSLMVAAALLSAGMFAATASLPKKTTTVNGNKPKTEISKTHKQNDKQKGATTKSQKAPKKSAKKGSTKK